jgi:hypothetical protein
MRTYSYTENSKIGIYPNGSFVFCPLGDFRVPIDMQDTAAKLRKLKTYPEHAEITVDESKREVIEIKML